MLEKSSHSSKIEVVERRFALRMGLSDPDELITLTGSDDLRGMSSKDNLEIPELQCLNFYLEQSSQSGGSMGHPEGGLCS